jgi:hypothetical protein
MPGELEIEMTWTWIQKTFVCDWHNGTLDSPPISDWLNEIESSGCEALNLYISRLGGNSDSEIILAVAKVADEK